MKKLYFILTLVFLLFAGCKQNFSKNPDYYSLAVKDYNKYKNTELVYTWNFNNSIDGGGHTYSRNYFEVKRYKKISDKTIPYLAQFKHEEGHIYTLNIVNVDNFDNDVYEVKCKKNLGTNDTVRNYSISIVEGVSDYYAIAYFENINITLGREYLDYTKKNIHHFDQYMKYYIGFLFANYTISKQIYPSIKEFVLNWCTEKQYNLFQQYVKSLKLS